MPRDTYWFRPGDVVELRSGGPAMSVEGYSADDDNLVVCQWYDEGRREYRREAFRLSILSLITD